MFSWFKKKEKMYYIVRFVFDVDQNWHKVYSKFMFRDVHINYKEQLVLPHKAEIVLGPLEERTYKEWQQNFEGTGCNFKVYVAEYEKVKDTNYFL